MENKSWKKSKIINIMNREKNFIDLQPLLATRKIIEIVLKEGTNNELEEMGGVQAFEIAYELSWKTLKKVLATKGVEVYSPKETFRKAAAEGLIHDFEA